MLPSGQSLQSFVAILRQYLCFELDWDAQLSLKAEEVPRAKLGQFGRLGWTTWAGSYQKNVPAADLILDAERATAIPTT
jgi:type VI secretion system protein ImpH